MIELLELLRYTALGWLLYHLYPSRRWQDLVVFMLIMLTGFVLGATR